jgi:hypothetical protein
MKNIALYDGATIQLDAISLIEEIASADSEASEAATGVRCNCCTGEGARSFSVG